MAFGRGIVGGVLGKNSSVIFEMIEGVPVVWGGVWVEVVKPDDRASCKVCFNGFETVYVLGAFGLVFWEG